MSLTCNIRNLAGQVKNRLVGERKRSLSSNDSNSNNNNDNNSEEEIINQMNSRPECSNPCEHRDQQYRSKTVTIIPATQTPTSIPVIKTTATSPRQHGTRRRQSSSPNNNNNSRDKRFQKQQHHQQQQQFQTTKSACQCHVNCINSSQPNCSSSTCNNNNRIENSNQLTPHLSPSCIHNPTLCYGKACKQSSGSSAVASPILQEQTRNYSVDEKDSHMCNQHHHHLQYHHPQPHQHHRHHDPNAQQHQSRQHVCCSNSDEQSRNHMNRNESQREDKTSSVSYCCDSSQFFNQNPGTISKNIENTTTNTTTVNKSNTSNQNIFQAVNYSSQLYGSTLVIPTVPDLSTGQNEVRSGSLGSAYPLHCMPYHFGQNRYGLFHGADYPYKRHNLQQRYHHHHHHQHQRYDHGQHHDPLPGQYQQHHHKSNSNLLVDNNKSVKQIQTYNSNNNNNPRLTMSYSELLNSMIPQHCHSQLSTRNNNNDDVSNSIISNNHKPDSFEGVTNLSKPKIVNSNNIEAPNTTIQHLCADDGNNDCHIPMKDNNKYTKLPQSPKVLINNSEIINNQIEDCHSTCSPQKQSTLQHNSSLDMDPPVLPTRTSSLIMHQKGSHMNKTDLKRNVTLSSCMIPGPSSSLLPYTKIDFMQQSMIDYPYNYDIISSNQSRQFISTNEGHHSRSHSTLSTRRGLKSYENTSQPATMTSSSETISNHEVMTTSFLQQQHSPNLLNKNANSNHNGDDDVNQGSIDEEFETLSSFPVPMNNSFNDESSTCQDKSSLDKNNNNTFFISDPIPISPSCGALEQFMPMNHASRLLGRMSDKLRDGRLADVILLAGIKSTSTSTSLMNTKCVNLISDHNYSSTTKMDLSSLPDELIVRIPAHRVILAAASDYFAAMFSNELKEATEQEIWIHEVDPYALKALINYIYTGHLDLREETVGDLLAAACFLQITEASQACERFLTKRLDATNCLSMSHLSEQYGCHLLRKRSTKFVLEHFSDVSQQPDFLNLTFKELVTLISSDRLRVSNEATVFAACLRWTRNAMVQENKTTSKSDGSESLLASLLRHVRLTQVPPRLLIDALEKEALFQEDLMAIHLIISALRVHFSSDSLHLQTHKTQRRTNMECCLKYNTGTNNSTHIVKTTTADNNNNISGVMNRLPDTKTSSLSSFSSLSTASIDEPNSISTSSQQQQEQQQQPERVGINNQDPSHNFYHHHHQGHSTDQSYQSPQFSNCRKSHNQVSDSYKCDAYMMNKPRPSTIGRLWALGGKTMTTTRALQEILEYDPYWNTWRTIGQLPGQRQQCGCIILTDGRLLVVGGRDELKTLSTVECINIEEMSQMYEFNSEHQKKLSNKSSLETTTTTATSKQGVSRSSVRQHSTDRNDIRSNDNQQDLSTELNSNSATALCPTTTISYRSEQQTHNSTTMNSKEIQSKEEYSSWKIVSAMATHRHGLGVAVLEGVVYAVGGHDGWSYLNTVERWNGKAKAWSPVTPMAVQRSTVGVAVLDGLLYAVGGRDGSACLRTVERFNPHTQHWCFIAPMLHRRGGVGVGAVGGRLYAVGGHNAPPNQPHALRTASVEMYEPHTDMWTEVSALSSPRDSIAVAPLGCKLYALGGYDGQAYTDRVEVYDPEENKWTEAAPLPSGRAGIAVAASGSSLTDTTNLSIKLSHHKVDPLI